MIKEKPILFSTPMVKAILSGNKTMTRRVVGIKKAPHGVCTCPSSKTGFSLLTHNRKCACLDIKSPYGRPGDLLWVRETTCIPPKKWADPNESCLPDNDGDLRHVSFRADGHPEDAMKDYKLKWTPSIHVPKWAARIWLKVISVRVERLQYISGEDAVAEGLCHWSEFGNEADVTDFTDLWDSINAARGYGWDSNPWVWVVEFERVDRPQAAKEEN